MSLPMIITYHYNGRTDWSVAFAFVWEFLGFNA